VRVARGEGIDGPVRIEIVPAAWLHGLAAEPLVLDKDHEEGVLKIECGPEPAPFQTARLLLRATAPAGADTVTAEASLMVVMDDAQTSANQ
jgi:hypothetical protein